METHPRSLAAAMTTCPRPGGHAGYPRSTMRVVGRLVICMLVSVGGFSVGSCSDSSGPAPEQGGLLDRIDAAQKRNRDALVSGAEIRAAKDSPAASMLRWWRLIQFRAPSAQVARLYVSNARPSRTLLTRQLRAVRYYFLERRPMISDIQRRGWDSQVFAVILKGDEESDPQVWGLRREQDKWRLANNEVLESRYRAELEFKRSQQDTGESN
jgi:hypothetical protein